MLSLSLARDLKEAGLTWTPAYYDFFAIPDRGLDDRIFVISDMLVNLALVSHELAVTFQGTVEWALDFVMVVELVWLPREDQLREELEQRLLGEPQPALEFTSTDYGYQCKIQFRGQTLTFEAFGASEAYTAALLHILKNTPRAARR
jgi:hypothetical protein